MFSGCEVLPKLCESSELFLHWVVVSQLLGENFVAFRMVSTLRHYEYETTYCPGFNLHHAPFHRAFSAFPW